MKKIISILCMLLVISSCFVFAGCDKKEDKFYEQTNTIFNTFVDEVCENDNYKNGLNYGTNVSTIISKIKNKEQGFSDESIIIYTQLEDVYDNMFISSFRTLAKFKGVFINIPKIEKGKEGQVKKEYQNFEKMVQDLTTEVSKIYTQVESMDRRIGTSTADRATTEAAFQPVKEFKREYIKLCMKFVELDNELLRLCETYIYPHYDSYKVDGEYIELNNTELVNQRTISCLKSIVNTITPAVKYLDKFDGKYIDFNKNGDKDKFFVTLDAYNNLDLSKSDAITVNELESWSYTFDIYTSDIDAFIIALDNVDLVEFMNYCESDIDRYLEIHPDKIAFVHKLFDFTTKSVQNLYSSVKVLCE